MSSQAQIQTQLTSRVHTYASTEASILANAYLVETTAGVAAATLTVSDANNFC